MKQIKPTLIALIALSSLAVIVRFIPGRPYGFAPQLAIAVFSGTLFATNKKWAFTLTLGAMLLPDIVSEILYKMHSTPIPGFYSGQWLNYLLFAGITCFGFLIKKIKLVNVLAVSFIAPTSYFLISNFIVWVGGGRDINNIPYPKNFSGMLYCFTEALPFYRNSIEATIFFSIILFGGYYLIKRFNLTAAQKM
jgi:hypothetical protein